LYQLNYVRPATLQEALEVLQEHPEARPLSGGMTLIPTMKQRLAAPSHVVDLSRLVELHGITLNDDRLRIGAATVHAEVAASQVVAQAIPGLAALAGLIADPQVRNRGTIGGSVANNDPAADYPAAVLSLNATVITSTRRIAADDFFIDMFETALAPGELIVAIEFPLPDQSTYVKCRQPASGYALTGVFIARFGALVRVTVTGAGTSVMRWHEAEHRLSRQWHMDALAGLRMDPSELLDEVSTPRRYRANLVEVMTRRALSAMLGQSQ
jgi:aerobic carbon-monoxide dehydrogenase medium subunit